MSLPRESQAGAPSPSSCHVRCPSDFRYREALARTGVRRIRRLCQLALGFDPVPTDEQMALIYQDMYEGDPVAEAFVNEVFLGPAGPRAGRQLLDKALTQGVAAVGAVPESMGRLFAEFEQVPEWVQPELVEEGARIWRRWGTTLFSVAGAGTLEMYTEGAVAVPLALTGGYAGANALRRYLETARFWIDVSEPGALFRAGSAGRATAMRVRVMHVSVRRRVAAHKEWDAERWGLPISQAYMMLTLLGGSVAPALALWPLGFQTSPRETLALLHFQRYLGHLLGVRSRCYPSSIREALQFLFAFMIARSYTSGRYGAELIESFPQAFVPRARPGTLPYLRELYAYWSMCGYCGFLSPGIRARYKLPPALPGVGLLFARAPFIAATEVARRFLPGAADFIDKIRCRERERWYALQMAGRKAMFEAKF